MPSETALRSHAPWFCMPGHIAEREFDMSSDLLQFESLEQTCIEYLSNAAHMMNPTIVSCLTNLAERLGLPALVDSIANALVTESWVHQSYTLMHIVSYFYQTDGDLKALFHHPQRGAFVELQLLQLLEGAGLPDDAISDVLDVTLMGSIEHTILLKILLKDNPARQHRLLRKALHQHLHNPEPQPQVHHNRHIRILDNVMLPDSKNLEIIVFPDSDLQLMIKRDEPNGKAKFLVSTSMA